jgi:hypothetical protein
MLGRNGEQEWQAGMAGRAGRQEWKARLAGRHGRQEGREDWDRMHYELMTRSRTVRTRVNCRIKPAGTRFRLADGNLTARTKVATSNQPCYRWNDGVAKAKK